MQPLPGGAACQQVWEEQPCQVQPCPIDCVLSAWSAWTACSPDCGTVRKKTRSRSVVTPAQHGGTCPNLTDELACPSIACNLCEVIKTNYVDCYSASTDRVVNPTGCSWSAPLSACVAGSCSYRFSGGTGSCWADACHFDVEGTCIDGPVCAGRPQSGTGISCTSSQFSPWCKWNSTLSSCVQGDCVVGPWKNGPCSHAICDGGTLIRARDVIVPISTIQGTCPILQKTLACNTSPCPTCNGTNALDGTSAYPFGRCRCDAPTWGPLDLTINTPSCGCTPTNHYGLTCNSVCKSAQRTVPVLSGRSASGVFALLQAWW